MKRYHGGTAVKGGYYWNLNSWEIVTVSGATGQLPLPADTQYTQVPLPALMILAPVMGAAYAVFLPFIGFAMASFAFVRKLGLAGKGAMEEMASTVGPAWRPGEAHFAGKGEEKKGDAKAAAPELDELQKKIEEQRKAEDKKH